MKTEELEEMDFSDLLSYIPNIVEVSELKNILAVHLSLIFKEEINVEDEQVDILIDILKSGGILKEIEDMSVASVYKG